MQLAWIQAIVHDKLTRIVSRQGETAVNMLCWYNFQVKYLFKSRCIVAHQILHIQIPYESDEDLLSLRLRPAPSTLLTIVSNIELKLW